jgi:DNA polymerase III subunit chi
MTRIDFYIRKENTLADRQAFACRLVQKASVLGHKIYIHCASAEDAHAMDKLLWAFQDTSFIPHKLSQTGGAECAIEIGYSNDNNACGAHHDLLINLGFDVPVFFTRFERLAEIVVQEPRVLEATRNNYRHYSHKNYPLHNHDMRA